ncbi:MAG: ATP-dependent Clp protease ATP-binding subunit [Pseudomonadota bacterium]
MLTYSPAIILAWQISVSEASSAKMQFVEKEHVLIGLLRALDVLAPDKQADIDSREFKILQSDLAPVQEILKAFELDKVNFRRKLRGIAGTGTYEHKNEPVHRSTDCKQCFTRAEEKAQLYGSSVVKPAHLLEAILDDAGKAIAQALSTFTVSVDDFKAAVHMAAKGEKIIAQKKEDKKEAPVSFLEKYGIDLTLLAREGKVEPLIGRRDELLKVIRTLSRKSKNNPLLIGEAGVGKTAIVHGLALRIAEGNIAPALHNKRIVEIQIGTIVAGTKYRGEFEEKLSGIFNEVKSDKSIILFIDELHTIIGAGRTEGNALDAANIMKPLLSQGDIRCIGATTIDEFRKYIEKDPALERRFQPVTINEPTEEETIKILKGLKTRYEAHHQVKISSSALPAAVKLSVRYLQDRHLPDKALDVIDEACTRVGVTALSFHGSIDSLKGRTGRVTEDTVAQVVADWSGCAVEKMQEQERDKLSGIEAALQKRVIGQDEAVARVSRVVKIARADIKNPKRPAGVFLFLGPTGVGKTELAKALAEFMFGSEDSLVRFDMSEYKEKHSASKLTGAPPGYAGYDEEGQLTGKLRRKPYSVVLFDEIEKAHPEILDIFLQLFDEGRLTDAKGKTADGRNAVFIMTSNLGNDQIKQRAIGFGDKDAYKENRSKHLRF